MHGLPSPPDDLRHRPRAYRGEPLRRRREALRSRQNRQDMGSGRTAVILGDRVRTAPARSDARAMDSQRQGDLLRLTWAAYDGKVIRLKQSKGRARVPVPVGGPIRDMLDAMLEERKKAKDHKAVTILTNSKGQPWTSDGFRTSWEKAYKRAKIEGLHFHDLRGTAVTRLALAGATVPEIASITGHSLKTVQEILDRHYLGGRLELAEAAIKKLDAVYGRSTKSPK